MNEVLAYHKGISLDFSFLLKDATLNTHSNTSFILLSFEKQPELAHSIIKLLFEDRLIDWIQFEKRKGIQEHSGADIAFQIEIEKNLNLEVAIYLRKFSGIHVWLSGSNPLWRRFRPIFRTDQIPNFLRRLFAEVKVRQLSNSSGQEYPENPEDFLVQSGYQFQIESEFLDQNYWTLRNPESDCSVFGH
ncbi:MAG: hypothetical protein AB7F43_14365 [Bacteriovoracia bacterium]